MSAHLRNQRGSEGGLITTARWEITNAEEGLCRVGIQHRDHANSLIAKLYLGERNDPPRIATIHTSRSQMASPGLLHSGLGRSLFFYMTAVDWQECHKKTTAEVQNPSSNSGVTFEGNS